MVVVVSGMVVVVGGIVVVGGGGGAAAVWHAQPPHDLARGAGGVGRMVDEERDVGDFLVDGHSVLGPEIVLAQMVAVVAGEDDDRVSFDSEFGNLAQNSADMVVEFDDERRASMVSNLLVVLCGEAEVNPVINTGTLERAVTVKGLGVTKGAQAAIEAAGGKVE